MLYILYILCISKCKLRTVSDDKSILFNSSLPRTIRDCPHPTPFTTTLATSLQSFKNPLDGSPHNMQPGIVGQCS